MHDTGLGRLMQRTAVALAAIAGIAGSSGIATAQDYSGMNLLALWYARNAIYAQAGFCFKTASARAVFGPGCFQPYGKLNGYQQQQIANILYWERRKGC